MDSCLRTGTAKIFTKIDLASAFWQIPVYPADREKTAFCLDGQIYVWCVMPFGLMNAPASFQRLIDSIFSSLKGKFFHAYIDDLLTYSDNFEDHLGHLEKILTMLAEGGLRPVRKDRMGSS